MPRWSRYNDTSTSGWSKVGTRQHRKAQGYTICSGVGCQHWLYNTKVEDDTTCSKCGTAFEKQGGRNPKKALALPDAPAEVLTDA